MSIFGISSIIKAGMNHAEKAEWEMIEKLLHSGEITQEEADRRRAELEDTLHKAFDGEQDEA